MPEPKIASEIATPHTIIIGAGWSGLAAAVELSKHKHRVTVLESAKQAGGRARSIPWDDLIIDNGQHLLIGAYQHTLALMKTLGLDQDSLFHRRPMELMTHILDIAKLGTPNQSSHQSDHKQLHIKAPRLPAPLHITAALLNGTGLSITNRINAVRFCLSLLIKPLHTDISVARLFQNTGQSDFLITHLWEPLCLAMLNTPINEASAQIFRRVLLDTFTNKQADSDFLIPAQDLGALLPEPAKHYIEQHQGQLLTEHRVISIEFNEQQHTVNLSNGQQLFADHIIIATPPYVTKRLIDGHPRLAPLSQQLARFEYSPICTVYLQYPKDVQLKPPAQGLTGTLSQWVFDRRVVNQPGLMAIVISADGQHMKLDNPTLTEHVIDELKLCFPNWPQPIKTLVIREKRATFNCCVGINSWRPDSHTDIDRLWLAGDYVNTGYPATLEGAVISGVECAKNVMA